MRDELPHSSPAWHPRLHEFQAVPRLCIRSRSFTSRDVRRLGIDAILDRALAWAGEGTEAIYVSFDVDVIDQAFAPGCPAIGTGGMDPWDALYRLGMLPQVQGLDFVCIDPTVDVRNVTSRLAVQFMLSFLSGMAERS
ncbi:arginase family protein [Paenibacillus sp. OSY-SE]|uniref:arginase family protein n=1 Tax=Paenibacillus sp. OSY-SE TaxID=1196323 RepID=UPI00047497DD|nr:arginase family protein [Paenibacillus sp. OSY-SE]